jgi:hypothetical protein
MFRQPLYQLPSHPTYPVQRVVPHPAAQAGMLHEGEDQPAALAL